MGLAEIDRAKPNWGNYNSNVLFLEETGLLRNSADILEIGAARGNMIRYLLESGHRAVGIDLEHDILLDAMHNHGRLPLLVGEGCNLPFKDQSFDFVLSFDVFEHIPGSSAHLSDVYRVLRPEGYYLLQTPNKWTNMAFEPIRFSRKLGIRKAFSFLDDHCSLHNYWQLTRRLSKAGFEVSYFEIPVVNQFFMTKVERFLGKPGLIALKIINPDKLPIPLRTNFFVAARKAS